MRYRCENCSQPASNDGCLRPSIVGASSKINLEEAKQDDVAFMKLVASTNILHVVLINYQTMKLSTSVGGYRRQLYESLDTNNPYTNYLYIHTLVQLL